MSGEKTNCPSSYIGWMSTKWDNLDQVSSIFLGSIERQQSDLNMELEA